jgi:hypothetical protein
LGFSLTAESRYTGLSLPVSISSHTNSHTKDTESDNCRSAVVATLRRRSLLLPPLPQSIE